MEKFCIYALLVMVGIVGAIGDGFFNEWAKRGGVQWLLAGYGMWMIMATIFALILKKELMGPAVILLLLSNVVFVLLISRYRFAEQLSPMQWSGIACAILALLLMEMGR